MTKSIRLFAGEGYFVRDGETDLAGPFETEAQAKAWKPGEAALAPKAKKAPKAAPKAAPVAPEPKAKAKAKKAPKAAPKAAPVAPEPTPAKAAPKGGTSQERHAWLEKARTLAVDLLAKAGTTVPEATRISIGMPYRANGRKTIGQCWHKAASADGHAEVFVSPVLTDSETILGVVVHELIHASLPDGEGHGPVFGKAARAVGLEGKLTATVPGEALLGEFKRFLEEAGPYPGGAIDPATAGGKKQGTRMLKADCPVCEYTVRSTKKWFTVALPSCPNPECPNQGQPMQCEGFGEPGEEEGDDD